MPGETPTPWKRRSVFIEFGQDEPFYGGQGFIRIRALAIDGVAVLRDPHAAVERIRELDELRARPGVQTEFVDNLDLPAGFHFGFAAEEAHLVFFLFFLHRSNQSFVEFHCAILTDTLEF